MIIPELPAYLTSIGGADYKGLIISLFTLTAGISRPFSGKLADNVGRIPVMVFGSVVCVICAILYPFFGTIWGFFLLRLAHGFSTGFQPTGTSAYVADLVPYQRRGEAMGLLGLFVSLGFAVGPAVGAYIAQLISVDVMFYTSSASALLSVLVLAGMKETLTTGQKFRGSHLKIEKRDVFEPKVFSPSLVMMLTGFSFGTILTIIPDFSDFLGISNRGVFFTAFTLASLSVRVLAGKASDHFGRVNVLKVATLTLAIAMYLIGASNSFYSFIGAAVLFGLASGISSPTIFAWTIDLSPDKHRGRSMATMFIALEIGIGTGALISGWLYANDSSMFAPAFWLGGGLAFAAFLYVVFGTFTGGYINKGDLIK
ncbi:MAG: putative MFS-type transporter YwoG [Cyclobacteriaceae bacterium]|nr:MAG: putative MFS-type transporter YwoG [Cyclobacteriaceae bacterium]